MWSKGVKEGYGEEIIGNTTRYRGEFKNNLRHGKGELTEKGGHFEGIFIKGAFAG